MNFKILYNSMLNKKQLYTLLFFLSLTVCINAQNDGIDNGWILEKVEMGKMKIDQNEWIDYKQEVRIEENLNVILNPKDQYDLNQELIVKPIEVKKEIISDFDKDRHFDQKVTLVYDKSDTDLLFRIGRGGLKVFTDSEKNTISSMLNLETQKKIYGQRIDGIGHYKVLFENGEETTIHVKSNEKLYLM